jgi:aryl-alcohol dehydrogenase-like predicted oxidoreductase
MIPKEPFGSTGHTSTRILFGAAALGAMSPKRADATLDLVLEHGVNHIDTAASYGEAEVRLKGFLRQHRDGFFLATKTGDRDGAGARDSLHRSLERMGVGSVDLIQLHNLVDETDWERALGEGGALEALIDAREQGLVRFIGVTGHGTRVAAMHRRSLERFPFDSVLLPCNHTMLSQPEYAADFEALVETCRARGVAVQTIKSLARRRWADDHPGPRFSWYEPLRDPQAIRRAVHFVLARPGLFLNSSSDATLLPAQLEAAAQPAAAPDPLALDADVARFAMRPLFEPGLSETI